jgi:hypothetical protein
MQETSIGEVAKDSVGLAEKAGKLLEEMVPNILCLCPGGALKKNSSRRQRFSILPITTRSGRKWCCNDETNEAGYCPDSEFLEDIMEGNMNLTEVEIEMLRQVARGDFNNSVNVPDIVYSLIIRGLVRISPSVVFPVVPQRNNYSLTKLGRNVLATDQKQ